MKQSEFNELRKEFRQRYASKRPWPLRIPPVHVIIDPPPAAPFKYDLNFEMERMSSMHRDVLELEIVMKFAISKGSFGFLVDRVGENMMVVDIATVENPEDRIPLNFGGFE